MIVPIYVAIHLAAIVSRGRAQDMMTMRDSRTGVSHAQARFDFDVDVAVYDDQAWMLSSLIQRDPRCVPRRSLRGLPVPAFVSNASYGPQVTRHRSDGGG
jgi:hypothetical protein